MTIQGDHIFLRRLAPQDAGPAYLRWLRDPAVNAFLEVRLIHLGPLVSSRL